MTPLNKIINRKIAGVTLVELMVALAIGSFLLIGAVQIYNQSRQSFIINESLARVQETAQFAIDTIESDLRMASNYGLQSRGVAIAGRVMPDDLNPLALPVPGGCGAGWANDLARPVQGENNAYTLACAANGAAQANSDNVTIRRATVSVSPLDQSRLQIQSTRIQGELFADNEVPAGFDPLQSQTHDLLVNTYYVSSTSTLIPGVPSLRRKILGSVGGAPGIIDQEVAPGIENLQIQFGIDIDGDNTVDRYVNPGDAALNPAAAGFDPMVRILTARLWILVGGLVPELGIQDSRLYAPGDVDLGEFNDQFRRLQISKTVLLRNSRT